MQQQELINIIDPIAEKYGVPSQLWEVVVKIESDWNPRTVGDNGTSFGLFQLHKGGQLPEKYNDCTPANCAVFDPALNAEIAMPYIAAAWKKLNKSSGAPDWTKGRYPNAGSVSWWYQFASLSGHPGEDPSGLTQQVAVKMQQEAARLARDPLPPSQGGNDSPSGRQPMEPKPFWEDWLQANLYTPIREAAPKVGLFLLAIIFVVAGLWAIAQNPGRSQ